ncbi:MAG TPA: L-threonylcarbamoyladenylate synthase [Candidatus Microsaccharimonas sp.]|nr:L-threonylcarbamoyladenylate synthase [Candidatus Microsaccharimonas sp.]
MFESIDQKLQTPGAVGVIPTDTVYGLAACATDRTAVQRLYDLKSREGKPGTLIAADTDQLVALGLKARYLKAVEQFWPGAVSVIIPCSDPALQYLHQGKYSLAVRIPDQPELLKLLEKTGPLVTSSANQPGNPTANSIQEARMCFGKTVDFYVDGGDLSGHKASTVIRVVDDAIEVLREGAVKIQENE